MSAADPVTVARSHLPTGVGRLVSLVVGVVLVAAACSGGDDDGGARPVHGDETPTATGGMTLSSTAFEPGGAIPDRFTCDGDDVSPPLSLSGVPDGVVTLALVMDDPDAPDGVWDHWIVYDIDPTTEIPADSPSLGTPGTNSWGRAGYGGPCPPEGTHRYFMTVYALDTATGLAADAAKSEVVDAIDGHVLAEATLIGTYGR
jgi:Raf kinase inhibitor-like YbhB/YbcL family protein